MPRTSLRLGGRPLPIRLTSPSGGSPSPTTVTVAGPSTLTVGTPDTYTYTLDHPVVSGTVSIIPSVTGFASGTTFGTNPIVITTGNSSGTTTVDAGTAAAGTVTGTSTPSLAFTPVSVTASNPSVFAPVAPLAIEAQPASTTANHVGCIDAYGPVPTSYTLQRSPAGTGTWTTVSSVITSWPYLDSGLTSNTNYDYRASATNGAGTSSYSPVASSLTLGGTAPAPTTLPDTLATMSSPYMYIPLLGKTYDVYVAKNGLWSSGSTWSTGVVPTTSQDVLIQAGATVVIDGTASARMTIVQEKLFHLPNATTSFGVNTISVMDTGTYRAGSQAIPVSAGHTCTVTFADGTFNTSSPGSRNYDPEMYGNGLLNVGTRRTGSQAKTRYARITTALSAGASSFTVPSALADPATAPTVTMGLSSILQLTHGANGGTFTLSVTTGAGTQTTSALAWNASASTVQSALRGLSNVGAGKATAIRFDPQGYAVGFDSSLGTALIVGNGSALTGPRDRPNVSTSGNASSLQPGTYTAKYTLWNGIGETIPSPESSSFTVAQTIADPVSAPTVNPTGGTGTGQMLPGNYTIRFAFVGPYVLSYTDELGETKASPSASFTVASLGDVPRASGWGTVPSGSSVTLYVSPPGYSPNHEGFYVTGITGSSYDLTAAVPVICLRPFPSENATAPAPIITVPSQSGLVRSRIYLSYSVDSTWRMYNVSHGTTLACTDPFGSFDAAGINAICNSPDSAIRTPATCTFAPLRNTTALSGWAIGDGLIIPETRQIPTSEVAATGGTNHGNYVHQHERATITGISGNVISFSPSLSYDHPAGSDYDGVAKFTPIITNTTLNVNFFSANPSGTRGHTLDSMMADAKDWYAGLWNLGRTLGQPMGSGFSNNVVDDTTFSVPGDATSTPTHIGTNPRARYPWHKHHLSGPMTPDPSGYQFQAIGCHVDQGDSNHTYKWAFDVHNSHFGLLRNNTTYNTNGAAFTNELGGEVCNTYEWNYSIRSYGSGQRVSSEGTDGAMYWSPSLGNYLRDNFAQGMCSNNVGYTYGFTIFGQITPNTDTIPRSPGQMAEMGGLTYTVALNKLPLLEHARNEVGSSNSGTTTWWVGYNPNLVPGQFYATQNTRIRDFSCWHHYLYGTFSYENARTIDDYWTVYGDPNRMGDGTAILYASDYVTYCRTMAHGDFQGMAGGITVPFRVGETRSNPYGSRFSVANSSFRTGKGVVTECIGGVGAPGSQSSARRTDVINCTFDNTSSGLTSAQNISREIIMGIDHATGSIGTGFETNVIQLDQVFVTKYQGNASDNFRVYAPQQAPSATTEQTYLTYSEGNAYPGDDSAAALVGTWTSVSSSSAWGGQYRHNDQLATSKATYSFDLRGINRFLMRIEASWVANAANTANATYQVYDGVGTGGPLLATFTVSHKVAPVVTAGDASSDTTSPSDGSNNIDHQVLGSVTSATAQLTIVLSGGTDGFTIADSIRVNTYGAWFVGSPVSGQTNTFNLSNNGVCTGGELAPCSTTRSDITGFAC